MSRRGGSEQQKMNVLATQKVCGCKCGETLPKEPHELVWCRGVVCNDLSKGLVILNRRRNGVWLVWKLWLTSCSSWFRGTELGWFESYIWLLVRRIIVRILFNVFKGIDKSYWSVHAQKKQHHVGLVSIVRRKCMPWLLLSPLLQTNESDQPQAIYQLFLMPSDAVTEDARWISRSHATNVQPCPTLRIEWDIVTSMAIMTVTTPSKRRRKKRYW